jgi:hypothetical protein
MINTFFHTIVISGVLLRLFAEVKNEVVEGDGKELEN